MKRATSTTINSSRKTQYLSPEQLQEPKSQKAQRFASRKLHIDGFLCVYDVSKVCLFVRVFVRVSCVCACVCACVLCLCVCLSVCVVVLSTSAGSMCLNVSKAGVSV